jgi:hypothetical protein
MSEAERIFTVQVKAPDGIIVADSFFVRGWDYDFDARLSYAVDYGGETEQVFDFPNREWSEVYAQYTEEVASRCKKGELLLAVLERRAKYTIRVVPPGGQRSPFDNSRHLRRWVKIVEGPLLIAEASELNNYAQRQGKAFVPSSLPLAPGDYVAEISSLRPPPEAQTRPREFWGPERAGLEIVISPLASNNAEQAGGGFFVISHAMLSS